MNSHCKRIEKFKYEGVNTFMPFMNKICQKIINYTNRHAFTLNSTQDKINEANKLVRQPYEKVFIAPLPIVAQKR